MSVKPFLPVLGYLYRAVNETMFFRQWTKYVAPPLFFRSPGGIEVSSVNACDAPILEFRVEPR